MAPLTGAVPSTFSDSLRLLPNVITVARILLVLPTAWFLWMQQYVLAVMLMGLAGASDALDGWLARRFSWSTRFGAIADPLADKLLVGVLFVVLTLQQHLPIWLVALAVSRDVIIMLGALTYRWMFGHVKFEPTFLSKTNTAMQLTLLVTLLLYLCGIPWLSALAHFLVYPYLVWVVAVLVVASGVDYAVTWTRRALTRRSGRVQP